jgi:ubiquinone/menaquinone biosynthesis C-methylase UbiE
MNTNTSFSGALRIATDVYHEVCSTYGAYYEQLSHVPADKLTHDVLSSAKVHEQVSLIERYFGRSIRGARILEIGAGYGLFIGITNLQYGADTFGIEPGSEGFGGSFEMGQRILLDNAVDARRLVEGVAEELPFQDASFDIVYSTNVFEHVQDPAQAFAEAIRVCKPGGLIQIVIPNYGSFYEGHYATWYVPHIPKRIWKWWLRYVQKRDPSYADTLRTELTAGRVAKMLRPYEQSGLVYVVSMGAEIFEERMSAVPSVGYAGLSKVFAVLRLMQRIHVLHLVTRLLVRMGAYSPLIISMRKSSRNIVV